MPSPCYLVFETGGTKLVAGVAGPGARLIDTQVLYRQPRDHAGTSFPRLVEAGQALRARHEAAGRRVAAIGFGFGGTVDRAARKPHLCLHEEGWNGIDVAAELESQFGLPVFLENDCKLGALAEAHFGAGRGARTVFYMTVGTGVGGGIVRDGRIAAFSDIGEAEIGHIVVDPEGPPCWCGGRGCVESVCSGPGMAQLAEQLARREGREFSGGGSKALFAAWQGGDPFATRVVEAAARYLATAAAAAINLLSPDVFVVGGGVGSAHPAFLDRFRQLTEPLVVVYFRGRCRIEPSELGDQVIPQGAALLAAQGLEGVRE